MLRLIAALIPLLAAVSCAQMSDYSGHEKADQVILLHGLARSERAMRPLASYLHARGYNVINTGYPSRHYPLDVLAADYLHPQIEQARQQTMPHGGGIHFVTHSMGGILIRQYLSSNALPELGRIVMLAPPNKGSELSDQLRDAWWFSAWNGPAGAQLGTDDCSVPLNLPDASGYELGVIAGNRSLLPFFSSSLPGDDDGLVSVESTKLDGMQDHLVLPLTHTFIMRDEQAMSEAFSFIRDGRFSEILAPAEEH